MAAIDIRKDSASAVGGVQRPRVNVIQRNVSVDVDNYKGTAGTSNGGYMLNAVGAGDTVKIINIPAGTLVLHVQCEVLTLGTGNLSVGDSGSGTQWMAATSIGSTGYKTAATTTPKLYSSDDYILLTFASANDGTSASQTPEVKITVVAADYNNYPPATTFTP